MNTGQAIWVAVAVGAVGGGLILANVMGPGSGDYAPEGPGSGDYATDPTGPGSGDYAPEGPGSGDYADPTGPGSGDYAPEGPGSGDYADPEGPGSGDYADPDPSGPGSGDYEDPEGPGSGETIGNAHSSCNAIGSGSSCVDYVGSYFSNDSFAQMNCGDPKAAWSADPCPVDTVGGCQVTAGSDTETIIWHYSYGGDPFVGAAVTAAAQACSINPIGTWIPG